MAGSKSDYLENKLLNYVLKNAAYSAPSTVYVGLYTAAPTDAGGGTEVSGNNYARKACTFSTATSGSSSNSGDLAFDTPSATWGTVVAFGVFDALTTGNLLYWADLTDNKTINKDDTVAFAAGTLVITEA